MKLLNIGFNNTVNAARIVCIVSPDSAPVRRIIQLARERDLLIDASLGRRTRAVIIMDSNHVILSSVNKETISARMESNKPQSQEEL